MTAPVCLAVIFSIPVEADCNGSPCVLEHQGNLTQSLAVSPAGTWVKEVELADFNEDLWLDIVMMQKQPLIDFFGSLRALPQGRKDVLYVGAGSTASEEPNFQLDDLSDFFVLKDNAFTGVSYATNRGYDAEVVDLDLDGNLDIIRPDSPSLLTVLWGNGAGRFLERMDVFAEIPGGDPNNPPCTVQYGDGFTNLGGNYDDVDVADLDGDGDLDFVVAQYAYCGSNLVFKNLAKQIPSDPRNVELVDQIDLPAKNTHSVDIGQANPDNDGFLDVLLVHGGTGGGPNFSPELYLATSNNFTFSPQPDVVFSQILSSMATTVGDIVGDPTKIVPEDDLSGDDLPDVFLAQGLDGGKFGVYVNTGVGGTPFNGSNGLVTCPTCATDGKYDVRYADLDMDGQIEAVMASINVGESFSTGNTTVTATDFQVFRFLDGGSFIDASSTFIEPTVLNRGGIAVAFGDLDNDGDQDVVLGGVDAPVGFGVSAHGSVDVYENRTLTRLANRDPIVSETIELLALKTLTAEAVTIDGTAMVTFRACEVVLGDGFRATSASGGRFVTTREMLNCPS